MNQKSLIVVGGLTLVKCSRLSRECISEEISRKCHMTKEKMYNGYKIVSILVYLYG